MENPPPNSTSQRGEAERLLGIASKLLVNRDLRGSRDFAILAQETEPLLDGSDQILAVTDVLLAAEDRVNYNHHDWYSILQIDRKSDDLEMAKRQYRRLALLLHPDKNKFPFADVAFNLVRDAWAVLSDSSKKSVYDNEMNFFFTKVDLVANETRNPNSNPPVVRNQSNNNSNTHQPQEKMTPVRRGGANSKLDLSFWTACPYCYVLYEYPSAYNECCLRCQKCERAFHAAAIESELPPLVHGKEAYYCCWSYFPLGFTSKTNTNTTINSAGFPNWMPPVFSNVQQPPHQDKEEDIAVDRNNVEDLSDVNGNNNASGGGFDMGSGGGAKKRGRPRKFPKL